MVTNTGTVQFQWMSLALITCALMICIIIICLCILNQIVDSRKKLIV
jgi:hypothetical protein